MGFASQTATGASASGAGSRRFAPRRGGLCSPDVRRKEGLHHPDVELRAAAADQLAYGDLVAAKRRRSGLSEVMAS